MRRAALLLVVSVVMLGAVVLAPHERASAAKALPPTNVAVHSGYVVVSTMINTSRYDTYVYISGQTPGVNFIYHTPVPATIANDPGWNCPCTAQIVYRAQSGTFKILTAPSAQFTPLP